MASNAKKTVEQLPCKLTAEEKLLKSSQLVQLAVERQQLEDEKKLATAALKAKIDQKKDEIGDLVTELHTGEELRPIECVERPRYDKMIVDIVRTDDGTVWKQRPIHPSERQEAFDLGAAGTVTSIGSAKKKPKRGTTTEDETPSDKH